MQKRDIFIGGAWPYANYYLHIGHLAALLPGDVLAKYFRLHGDNVIMYLVQIVMGHQLLKERKKKELNQKRLLNIITKSLLKLSKTLVLNMTNIQQLCQNIIKNMSKKNFYN